jgi:hypothetical protein
MTSVGKKLVYSRPKTSKLSSPNVAFTKQICEASARRSASPDPMHAATNGFWSFNGAKISRSRNYRSCGALVPFLAEIPLRTEYFWGMTKNIFVTTANRCSFDGLKENLPKAVPIQIIRRWEHWLFRWVDAYWAGLGSVEAQF